MSIDWVYLTYEYGKLYDEMGDPYTDRYFASEEEAEQWLIDNDCRASIR